MVYTQDDEDLGTLRILLGEYANYPDDKLTVGAKRLKKQIIDILHKYGWYQVLVLK